MWVWSDCDFRCWYLLFSLLGKCFVPWFLVWGFWESKVPCCLIVMSSGILMCVATWRFQIKCASRYGELKLRNGDGLGGELVETYCLNLVLSWNILFSPSMVFESFAGCDVCGLLESAGHLPRPFWLLESLLRNQVKFWQNWLHLLLRHFQLWLHLRLTPRTEPISSYLNSPTQVTASVLSSRGETDTIILIWT